MEMPWTDVKSSFRSRRWRHLQLVSLHLSDTLNKLYLHPSDTRSKATCQRLFHALCNPSELIHPSSLPQICSRKSIASFRYFRYSGHQVSHQKCAGFLWSYFEKCLNFVKCQVLQLSHLPVQPNQAKMEWYFCLFAIYSDLHRKRTSRLCRDNLIIFMSLLA